MKHVLFVLIGMVVAVKPGAAAVNVSAPIQPAKSAAGNSYHPIFSADGHHLVFVSHANNLVTNDDQGLSLDIFVRDLVNSNTVLVSVSTNGFGGANVDANYPSVSSNGQFIAFASRASNLVSGDTNEASDVFVRDVVVGTTRLVSVGVNGTVSSGSSGYPQISADGRWVFFESGDTNLATNALGSVNIYRRDMTSNTLVLASANVGLPVEILTATRCELSSITSDARFLAYVIISNSTSTVEAYVGDMDTLTTTLISTNVPGLVATNVYRCSSPVLSADGRFAAFFVEPGAFVLRHDLQTGTTLVISSAATNVNHGLQMSADGRFVLFEEMDGNYGRVRLWDAQLNNSAFVLCSGEDVQGNAVMDASASSVAFIGCSNIQVRNASPFPILISANTNGVPSGGNYQLVSPVISPDGTRVAFATTASDLVAGDWNNASDIFLRDVNAGVTELITPTHPAKPAQTSAAHSFLGLNSISADARFVVFTRYDDPSAYRDTNGWADVFLTDLWSNITVAVSVNANLSVTNYGGGGVSTVSLIENTNAYLNPVISADGSTIYATRRTPNGHTRVVGVTTTNAATGNGMTVASRGINVGENGDSSGPSVSSNGLLLTFTSSSTDLVEGVSDLNSGTDVFLRRTTLLSNGLVSASNELISVALSGNAGNGVSSNAFLSPDARWVIFESRATDQTTNILDGSWHLFAHDVLSNVTYLVSVVPVGDPQSGSPQPGYKPGSAVMSGNSRYVAFSTANPVLILHDLTTHTGLYVDSWLSHSPALNADGRFVASLRNQYISGPNQVYVRDRQGAQADLVSANSSGLPGNRGSSRPLLSGDGRYIVFSSWASDLVPNDLNTVNDVFVRDRLLNVTMVVSANVQGRSGNGPSSQPVLAADGRTVVFQSFANDLVGGDYNDKRDLFVLKLGSADTDGDGMDDDLEVAYFGNLSRDGSGDYDNDGATDLAEFHAGTDPTNSNSVFRVLTVAPAGGGNTLLLWTGNAALSYRAEFKDDLAAADWIPLTGPISWNGTTASTPDLTATNSTHRYYRVVRVP